MLSKRRATLIAGTFVAWLAAALPALAQCPMCKLAAENAGDPLAVQRTFNSAILVLLIPVLGLIGGVVTLFYRWK